MTSLWKMLAFLATAVAPGALPLSDWFSTEVAGSVTFSSLLLAAALSVAFDGAEDDETGAELLAVLLAELLAAGVEEVVLVF